MRIANNILLTLGLSTITSLALVAQDKGKFEPVANPYYEEMLRTLDKKASNQEPKSTFKAVVDSKKLPQSPDEFSTIWCQPPLSQGRTGTCWSFSTSSFYESEILRITRKEIKLSELFTVYWEYVEKAKEYVNTRGNSFFGEGSETNAVARMMERYGAVPNEAYNGMKNNTPFHDHEKMYQEMNAFLQSIKRDNAWNEETVITTIKTILNHYIGTPPTTFQYDNKEYNPKTFLNEVCKIQPTDYVNFMSLMESPYFTKALYNVPDNWWKSRDYYNVPLQEFMQGIDMALKNGYSLSIGGDVSEAGYLPFHDCAFVPTFDIPSNYIDENARQFRFLNGSTTDDHAIHLIGHKETPEGKWYLIKDSGSGARNGKNKGYYFYHEDYVKLKMMTYTVHKDAVKSLLDKMKK